MSQEATFWLPFPPSTNGLFAHGMVKGKVRRFPTKAYKQWRSAAVLIIRSQRLPQFTEPVVIKLALTPRDGRRRDASNYVKAVEDALVEARLLIDDDQRYVKSVIPYWCEPNRAHEGVTVTIRPAENVRPILDAPERLMLGKIKRGTLRLCSPAYRPSKAVKTLIEKGYIEDQPGLIDGCPQSYIVTD